MIVKSQKYEELQHYRWTAQYGVHLVIYTPAFSDECSCILVKKWDKIIETITFELRRLQWYHNVSINTNKANIGYLTKWEKLPPHNTQPLKHTLHESKCRTCNTECKNHEPVGKSHMSAIYHKKGGTIRKQCLFYPLPSISIVLPLKKNQVEFEEVQLQAPFFHHLRKQLQAGTMHIWHEPTKCRYQSASKHRL